MNTNTSRSFLITTMMLIVLVFSAVMTVPAYADDSAPPPTDTPIDESAPPAESAAPAPGEILAQVSDDTPVVVVNDEGEVLPLATEEAAQTLVSGDPMWCPVGVTPGGAGCTPSSASFNGGGGLIAAINNKTVAGVIWVENTYSSTETLVAINLNFASVGTTSNFPLTINGGWTGAGTAISGVSVFSVPLLITGWTGAVTLNNILIYGASITNAADNQALSVVTNGNILLNNVSLENNNNPGAGKMNGGKLDNTSSSVAATVTIKNAAFDQSEGKGLEVYSDGIVTINNLSVNGNAAGNGAIIDNTTASADKPVTITGVQQFNNNGGYGLQVLSDGAITLGNLAADNNATHGVWLDNTTSLGNLGITIKGINEFKGNSGAGLLAYSHGTVTFNSLAAEDNGDYGVFIDNYSGTPAPKAVTISGTNIFNHNGLLTAGSGLAVGSLGAITLSNVTASNNSVGLNDTGIALSNAGVSAVGGITIKGYGTFEHDGTYGLFLGSNGIILLNNINANFNGLDGVYATNTTAVTDKGVTIAGTQAFNYNGSVGLRILSDGAIALGNLVANNNGNSGVSLTNTTSLGNLGVTIKGANQFNNNGANGLFVGSHGLIKVNSVTADNNTISGAYLDNATGALLPKALTITGTNIFNSNGTGAAGFGLYVLSHGAITVSNLTANNNSIGGNDAGVRLSNAFPSAAGGVTITGYGTFEHNSLYGLQIFSTGAILLNNISADNNGHGAVIDNCGTDFLPGSAMTCLYSGKALTLKGTNNFNDNSAYGLEGLSGGAIVAANLNANRNGTSISAYGIDLDAPTIGNTFLESIAGITLTGANSFSKNAAGQGLTAIAYGPISLSNITAYDNADYGVYIKNDFVNLIPWNVTLTGTSQFNENGFNGLEIRTYGAVVLNNITASYNAGGGYGLYVVNNSGLVSLPKPITLNGFNNFNNNGYYGAELDSRGVLTVNNVIAEVNSGDGLYLGNDGAAIGPASPGVFVKGNNSFSNNGTGLEVHSVGAITLNNINVDGNGGHGAYVINSSGLLKPVTITGVNNFNGNGSEGLYMIASGAVTLSRITANSNTDDGIHVTTPGNITLTCGYTYNNGNVGTYLHSTGGVVIVKGLYAFSSGITDVDLSSFLPAPAIIYPCAVP